jgi:hypothetical protein
MQDYAPCFAEAFAVEWHRSSIGVDGVPAMRAKRKVGSNWEVTDACLEYAYRESALIPKIQQRVARALAKHALKGKATKM